MRPEDVVASLGPMHPLLENHADPARVLGRPVLVIDDRRSLPSLIRSVIAAQALGTCAPVLVLADAIDTTIEQVVLLAEQQDEARLVAARKARAQARRERRAVKRTRKRLRDHRCPR